MQQSDTIRWETLLFFLFVIVERVASLEEVAPEVYLQPRNFNPHPYETGGGGGPTGADNNGPAVFPTNSEDNAPVQSNFITLSRNNHPVDNHPYVKVAQKNQYRLPGKYHTEVSGSCRRMDRHLMNHDGLKVNESLYMEESLIFFETPALYLIKH